MAVIRNVHLSSGPCGVHCICTCIKKKIFFYIPDHSVETYKKDRNWTAIAKNYAQVTRVKSNPCCPQARLTEHLLY